MKGFQKLRSILKLFRSPQNFIHTIRNDLKYKTIYLNKDLFKSNFGKFFAILTHEMSHVFGKDGEREFSDVLTHLIEQAVSKNSVISKYSRGWAKHKA